MRTTDVVRRRRDEPARAPDAAREAIAGARLSDSDYERRGGAFASWNTAAGAAMCASLATVREERAAASLRPRAATIALNAWCGPRSRRSWMRNPRTVDGWGWIGRRVAGAAGRSTDEPLGAGA